MSDKNETPIEARNRKLGATLVSALESRQFEAHYIANAKEAAQLALSLIPKDDVVSWGGSVSIQESGLLDLVKKERKVIDRDTAKSPEERMELLRKALTCDTFLASSNAVSENGELVNIDGYGNRVAAMSFGPSRVIILAGINKVVKSLDDAIARTRHIAAPINTQRFKLETPCLHAGVCRDCKSKDCICSCLSIIRFCRPAGRIKVIICGEPLGY